MVMVGGLVGKRGRRGGAVGRGGFDDPHSRNRVVSEILFIGGDEGTRQASKVKQQEARIKELFVDSPMRLCCHQLGDSVSQCRVRINVEDRI